MSIFGEFDGPVGWTDQDRLPCLLFSESLSSDAEACGTWLDSSAVALSSPKTVSFSKNLYDVWDAQLERNSRLKTRNKRRVQDNCISESTPPYFLRAISTQLFESQGVVLLGHEHWRVFPEKGGTATLANL
jgi:hypothetical protein